MEVLKYIALELLTLRLKIIFNNSKKNTIGFLAFKIKTSIKPSVKK